jgi:hypothetical protein
MMRNQELVLMIPSSPIDRFAFFFNNQGTLGYMDKLDLRTLYITLKRDWEINKFITTEVTKNEKELNDFKSVIDNISKRVISYTLLQFIYTEIPENEKELNALKSVFYNPMKGGFFILLHEFTHAVSEKIGVLQNKEILNQLGTALDKDLASLERPRLELMQEFTRIYQEETNSILKETLKNILISINPKFVAPSEVETKKIKDSKKDIKTDSMNLVNKFFSLFENLPAHHLEAFICCVLINVSVKNAYSSNNYLSEAHARFIELTCLLGHQTMERLMPNVSQVFNELYFPQCDAYMNKGSIQQHDELRDIISNSQFGNDRKEQSSIFSISKLGLFPNYDKVRNTILGNDVQDGQKHTNNFDTPNNDLIPM